MHVISCVRTQCQSPVAAGLAVNPPRREAWLIPWPEDPFLITPICDDHAESITVPSGWLLHDEREGATSLFAERSFAANETATVTRLDHRRARRALDVEELTLFALPASEPMPATLEGIDEENQQDAAAQDHTANQWIGEPGERHTELLDVDEKTPLLARAFRASQAS